MNYHYMDSGLDNVWLVNGFSKLQTAYGKGVTIENIDSLHSAIGRWLIETPKPLNGAELRFLRLHMELTQNRLAKLLGVDEQAVRRWEKARSRAIHGAADRLLRGLYGEYAGGDGSLRRMVDRLAELDQLHSERGFFGETAEGWVQQKST